MSDSCVTVGFQDLLSGGYINEIISVVPATAPVESLGEGFFDDDDVLSNVDGGSEEEEELGPLREGAKKGKSAGKSGRKPVARKSAGGGAKRKSASGAGKPPAKKEKK